MPARCTQIFAFLACALPLWVAAADVPDEARIAALIAQLESEQAEKRTAAAQELGKLGSAAQAAAPALIRIIDDKTAVIHNEMGIKEVIPTSPGTHARRALAQMGTNAVPYLVQGMTNETEVVRWRIVETLGLIQHERAVPPVVRALDDDSRVVRIAAAEALSHLGNVAVQPLIADMRRDPANVSENLVWALGEIADTNSIAPLIALLMQAEPPLDEKVSEALVKIGTPVVDPLIAILKGGSTPAYQVRAADVLGRLGVERAAPPLLEAMLAHPSPEVRIKAMQALVPLNEPWLSVPLLVNFTDSSRKVSAEAQRLLRRLGPGAAVPISAYLDDPHPKIAQAAFVTLHSMGPVAKSALEAIVRDRTQPAGRRKEAAQSLAVNNLPPTYVNDQVMNAIMLNNWPVLSSLGMLAVTPMIEELDYVEPINRAVLAQTLAFIGHPDAIEPIVGMLGDPDPQVVRGANAALTRFGQQAEPDLVRMLKEGNLQESGNAAHVLKLIDYRPVSTTEEFEYLIAGQEWETLAEVGRPVLTYLIEILTTHPSADRRVRAAWAIASMRETETDIVVEKEFLDPDAFLALFTLNPAQKIAGISGLVTNGNPDAASYLLVPLFDTSGATVVAAAEALASLSPEPRDLLIEALSFLPEHPHHGPGLALAALPHSPGPALLERYHATGSPEIRNEILRTLESIPYRPEDDAERAAYFAVAGRMEDLAAMGDAAIPALMGMLDDEDILRRRNALAVIAGIPGDVSFNALAEATRDPAIDVRALAVIRLKDRGEPGIDPLNALLFTADAATAGFAAHTLSELGFTPTTLQEKILFYAALEKWAELGRMGLTGRQFLIDTCRTGAPNPSLRAAIALTQLRGTSRYTSSEFFDGLYASLRDDNSANRATAAALLGNLRQEGSPAIDRLIDLLADDTVVTNRLPFIPGAATDTTPGRHAAVALARIGKHSIESLVAALNDTNDVQRANAELSLSLIPDERLVNYHSALILRHEQSPLAVNAAASLGRLADPKTVPVLLKATASREKMLSRTARQALTMMGPAAADPLAELLAIENLSPDYRATILSILADLNDSRAVDALIASTNKGAASQRDRTNAARALARFPEPRVAVRLVEMLGDRSRFVRWAAAESLIEIGGPAVEPLLAAMFNPSGDSQDVAYSTLRRITRQSFGMDMVAWRNWWDAQPKPWLTKSAQKPVGE